MCVCVHSIASLADDKGTDEEWHQHLDMEGHNSLLWKAEDTRWKYQRRVDSKYLVAIVRVA